MFRNATMADLDQVAAIYDRIHTEEEAGRSTVGWIRGVYPTRQTALASIQAGDLFVAEEDGRVIAYAGAWLIFEEGHITNIAVDEPYRGRGVGTEVTRALMQYAANMGVQYLTLEVRRSNLVAQKMYQSLGFLKLGLRKRYYEDNGEDAYLMVCQDMPPVDPDFTEDAG